MERTFALILALLFAAALLAKPDTVAVSVRSGLMFFACVLIPALFPMTFVTAFIMKLISGRGFKGGNTAVLFIFLFSLVGGYIVGAKLISDAVRGGTVSKKQGELLCLVCVNGGVGFSVTAVGTGVLGSFRAGIILFLCNIFYSTVGFLLLLPRMRASGGPAATVSREPVSALFCDTVGETARIVIGIGGFIVIFSAIGACVKPLIPSALCDLLEVTTAVNNSRSLPYLSFLIGFGGISVIFQILSVPGGVADIKTLLPSRILHGAFSFLTALVVTKVFKIAVPVAGGGGRTVLFPYYDRLSVSVFAAVSVVVLILSLEGKIRGGNLREDLLQ